MKHLENADCSSTLETSMTYGGIGPRLALLCLPYIILALIVMYRDPEFSDLKVLDRLYIKVLGFVWLGLGIIFWVYSAIYFLRYFRAGKLIKDGPFALCRNPIYSSLIVFIIPSLALIFHSGLLSSISLVLYSGFKISIHGESLLLRRAFGDEYEKYENSVNEIIPFPRYLLRGKV
jgi:protein-S-isoprenylcysteine O-methyltransferase Ste14